MWAYTPKQTGDIFWLAYEIAEDIILCYLTSNIHYGYVLDLFGFRWFIGFRFNIVLGTVSIVWIHVEQVHSPGGDLQFISVQLLPKSCLCGLIGQCQEALVLRWRRSRILVCICVPDDITRDNYVLALWKLPLLLLKLLHLRYSCGEGRIELERIVGAFLEL